MGGTAGAGGGGGARTCDWEGTHWAIHGTMADFSYDNLSNNPKFDFVKQLHKTNLDDENECNFISANSPYDSSVISCSYMCESDIIRKYRNSFKPSILSINIQSISAKFADLCSFISSLAANNCSPDIICLQEIWRIPGNEHLIIDGYHPLEFQCRRNNVQGGGVGIYVKKIFSYTVNNELSVFVDRILESLFIEVSINSKKICIGSLYYIGLALNMQTFPVTSNSRNFVTSFLPLLTPLIAKTTLPIYLEIQILIVLNIVPAALYLTLST